MPHEVERGAFARLLSFLAYLLGRERLEREDGPAGRSEASFPGWLAGREELGRGPAGQAAGRSLARWVGANEPLAREEVPREPPAGSFLRWLVAREELPRERADGSDKENPHE